MKGLKNSEVVSYEMLSYFILLRECAPIAFRCFENGDETGKMKDELFNNFPKIGYLFNAPKVYERYIVDSRLNYPRQGNLFHQDMEDNQKKALRHALSYFDGTGENIRQAITRLLDLSESLVKPE